MNVKCCMSYHVNYTQIIAWQTGCSEESLVSDHTGKQGP